MSVLLSISSARYNSRVASSQAYCGDQGYLIGTLTEVKQRRQRFLLGWVTVRQCCSQGQGRGQGQDPQGQGRGRGLDPRDQDQGQNS